MSEPTPRPPRSFRLIALFAVVWNLIGIATYLMQVTMTPEALAELPEAERALYANIPPWATGAYAIAVFVGTAGALALLLRRVWAIPLFAVSLVGILVQMAHTVFLSDMVAVKGALSLVMPVVVVVIAVLLLGYSARAARAGWLS